MNASILSDSRHLAPQPKSQGWLNYTPGIWDRFASKLAAVDEAPEPLRSALREQLSPEDSIRLLVFGPANRLSGKRSPATLLAVTDSGWFLASDAEDGEVSVAQCDFANTLLLELTAILLHGRLKIVFATGGRTRLATAEFNTVMEAYYQEAAQLLLDGIDGISTNSHNERKSNSVLLDSLPMKFHNALTHFEPGGQRVLDFAHWPAIIRGNYRWLQHELAPEALLALSDRELVFISEEKPSSWFRNRHTTKYGSIVTYCPLSRLDNFEVSESELIDTVNLELHAAQGGEKVKIDFPGNQKEKVTALVERAMAQRANPTGGMDGLVQPITDLDTTSGRIIE